MFILGIVMHEIGHLLGGLISGYRFLYIEAFGFTMERKKGNIEFKRYRGMPIGQCMMYSENMEKRPFLLIAGGMIMNAALGMLTLMLAVSLESAALHMRLLIAVSGMANLSLVPMNIFGSRTSDGTALKEVLSSRAVMKTYNGIMLLDAYLWMKKMFEDIPDDYFIQMTDCIEKARQDKKTECELVMEMERYLKEWKHIRKGKIG